MISSRGRARFGVLVPFTNTNLEADMALMCPEGISIHVARLGGYDADEIPDETQMQGLGTSDLEEPLRLLMGVKPDVVMYGCTSATLTHGPEFDRTLAIECEKMSGAKTVTAASALVHALEAMNIRRIGFASPYVPAINDMAVDFLNTMGFETVVRSEVDETLGNDDQGAMTPEEVMKLAIEADHPQSDALVLSCTDMRSVEVIDSLETKLGKPVVTSNQAMLFQALQLIGFNTAVRGFGQLLERELL